MYLLKQKQTHLDLMRLSFSTYFMRVAVSKKIRSTCNINLDSPIIKNKNINKTNMLWIPHNVILY